MRAVVRIQRWWRAVIRDRKRKAYHLHHSPKVRNFKSSNLSMFSSAKHSSEDIRSCAQPRCSDELLS